MMLIYTDIYYLWLLYGQIAQLPHQYLIQHFSFSEVQPADKISTEIHIIAGVIGLLKSKTPIHTMVI